MEFKGQGMGGRTALWWIVSSVALLVSSSACGPAARGGFSERGYSSSYGYDIGYSDAPLKRMLPPGWQLDNYRSERGKLEPKTSADYVTKYEFDNDDDGATDEYLKAQVYALRFEHRVHSGAIWLRDVPMSSDLRVKDLRVLMQSYIEEIAGTNYEIVRLGATSGIVKSREYATQVVTEGPITVAGSPAYFATVEVASVEQLNLSQSSRSRRVELVILRAPQEEQFRTSPTADKKSKVKASYPVLLVAGYSNMPADFDVGLIDFHEFLGRLAIGGKRGLEMGVAANPGAQPSSAPPAQTTPPAPAPTVVPAPPPRNPTTPVAPAAPAPTAAPSAPPVRS